MRRREFVKFAGFGAAGWRWHGGPNLKGLSVAASRGQPPKLKIAASRFATEVELGAPTFGRTGAKAETVAGPLKTTVVLVEDGRDRLCLVASDFFIDRKNTGLFLRTAAAEVLGLDPSRVLLFSSHNHSVPCLAEVEVSDAQWYTNSAGELPGVKLFPVGERLVSSLQQHLRGLQDALEPARVFWAQGREGRITYNRKGRRADGSTYFMREEDRKLVGKDFNGDIEREVPVVVFQREDGKRIAALLQFAGHPVTSYHPEQPVIFGDYPTAAADWLGQALSEGGPPVPVAFLQGCAGDLNSKEMFEGGVQRAQEFGEMLGRSAVDALSGLTPSRLDGMDFTNQTVAIPLSPLPGKETILAEITEMKDFVRRANAGDEATLSCVGLNFPKALSPRYRSALVNVPLSWNEWALRLHEQGKENTVMRSLDVPVCVLRLGDVAVVGMPFEPFLGIGRRIRAQSPCALTIPCGYVNGSHGYVTDSANTGDREYMSSQYRYTRFRPPFAKPAGDVAADCACETLRRFWQEQHDG